MTARYRLVHFVPDPFLGGRIPIAALVEHGGRVSVAKLPHIPGPTCLGGRQAAALVQLVLEDLMTARRFDRLPTGVGPQCVLDKERAVPAEVEDARKWVETCLAGVMDTATTVETKHIRGSQRATWGYRFFQNYKVDRYVRKTFKPGQDADNFLASASALGPVSHYVEGKVELLLMEPIAPRKSNWETDVHNVARTFGAYKTALRQEKNHRSARLTAYVLAGGDFGARDSIMRDLAPFADDVVDTENVVTRSRFLSRIKETGSSGSPELFND